MDAAKTIALEFALSFALTFASAVILIRLLKRAGMVGVDHHKREKPEIPEMGGLAVVFGYATATAAGAALMRSAGYGTGPVLAALGVFLIAAFVGVLDDLYKLSHKVKPVLLLAAAAPLVALHAGAPQIRLPYMSLDFADLFGRDLSPVYWLVVVPVAVSGAANVSNMLAGFNGLMSGSAFLSSSALALIAWRTGNPSVSLIFAGMAASQLAFLHFNKYPAKVFPGDVGTLSFGALYAAGILLGKMEFLGLLAFLPQLFNASMSLLSVGRFFEEGQFKRQKLEALLIGEDGRISFIKLEKPITLCKLLLFRRPQSEYSVVRKVWVLSLFSSLLAVLAAVIWW